MRQRYQRTSGAVIIEHTADEENALNNELALKALIKKFSTLCTL